MGDFTSSALTGDLPTLCQSASSTYSGPSEQSTGLWGSGRIFVSPMLDPSDLHVVGASINGSWMREQEMQLLQIWFGQEGHCVLLALRVGCGLGPLWELRAREGRELTPGLWEPLVGWRGLRISACLSESFGCVSLCSFF